MTWQFFTSMGEKENGCRQLNQANKQITPQSVACLSELEDVIKEKSQLVTVAQIRV